jgi:hypothetical protein
MKIALTPQPPLPERRGGAKSRKLLSPSPFGRGARGEGLRNFHVTSVKERIWRSNSYIHVYLVYTSSVCL